MHNKMQQNAGSIKKQLNFSFFLSQECKNAKRGVGRHNLLESNWTLANLFRSKN